MNTPDRAQSPNGPIEDTGQDSVTYFIKVTNSSNAAVHNAVASDAIPQGLRLVEGSISDGGTLDEDGKTITWHLGNLAAGESRTVHYTARMPESPSKAAPRHMARTWADEVKEPVSANEATEHTVSPKVSESFDTPETSALPNTPDTGGLPDLPETPDTSNVIDTSAVLDASVAPDSLDATDTPEEPELEIPETLPTTSQPEVLTTTISPEEEPSDITPPAAPPSDEPDGASDGATFDELDPTDVTEMAASLATIDESDATEGPATADKAATQTEPGISAPLALIIGGLGAAAAAVLLGILFARRANTE